MYGVSQPDDLSMHRVLPVRVPFRPGYVLSSPSKFRKRESTLTLVNPLGVFCLVILLLYTEYA